MEKLSISVHRLTKCCSRTFTAERDLGRYFKAEISAYHRGIKMATTTRKSNCYLGSVPCFDEIRVLLRDRHLLSVWKHLGAVLKSSLHMSLGRIGGTRETVYWG